MITLTWPLGQLFKTLASFLGVLVRQVLYITPLFWFLELSENVAWRWMNGTWGWVYPESPYEWFSFNSLFLWAAAVTMLWALHHFWFYPRRVKLWQRLITSTVIGWMGEWFAGFIAAEVFHHPLQIWPNSQLVYVSFSALFFWLSNTILYHLLTLNVVELSPAYDLHLDEQAA
ncbi:hypothetical protein JGU66_35900 [Myxococcaceae bacterium JPH2]|nr:hypothetical protein [Myxococcaceae bacterium JPH2]